jgi:hypothetical protein
MARSQTTTIRARQLGDLVRAEVRAMRLGPLAGGVGLTALLVGLALRHRITDPAGLVPILQIVAIALGLGFAFIFDDPSADSISSAPTSLLFRRALRVTVSAASVGAVWGAVLLAARLRAGQPIPMGIPSLYLITTLTFVVATACATGRATREGPGGIAGGPLLLLVIGLSRVLPPRFRFFEADTGHGYSTALRLAVVAVLSVAVALWASLDPGRPVRGLATLKRRR